MIFHFFKMGLISCGMYLSFTTAGVIAMLVATRLTGGIMIMASRTGWTVLSLVTWLISYQLAWQIAGTSKG